jgi:uncharacterized membrane protein
MSWASRFERRRYLAESLWALPLLGGVVGAALAQAALWADRSVSLPSPWQYSPQTASGVLTAIVGAMVGLLGFVVTIGVLVVQQATGMLSPRFMGLWYRNRLQKAVLALFAGTFTFAFSLLRRVEDQFVPDIGVTAAGVAVAASLGMLLIYLNRFTHYLRPVAAARMLSQRGQDVLASNARVLRANGLDCSTGPGAGRAEAGPVRRVRSDREGAVQAIHLGGLVSAARGRGCTIVVIRSVGDFVRRDADVFEVCGGRPPPDRDLLDLVAVGPERTLEQDPAFALRVLVDIAIKALSPAINDPTSASQVLDHIQTFLRAVARTEPKRRYELLEQGVPRVVLPGLSWVDYLRLAVTEIRDYSATSTQVRHQLRAMLRELLDAVPRELRPPVLDEIGRLDAVVRARSNPARRRASASSDASAFHPSRVRSSARWRR